MLLTLHHPSLLPTHCPRRALSPKPLLRPHNTLPLPAPHADGLLERLLQAGTIAKSDVADGVHCMHPAYLSASLDRSLGEALGGAVGQG